MSTEDTLLLHFDDEREEASRLARAAGLEVAEIERHRFPDDELRLRLPAELPANMVLFRSLHRPNEKLLELLLVARSAGRGGARHLTLVAPYLAYMRQDKAFHPGEVVSQRIVGEFLAGLFDGVITVDPHLHRISSLAEAIPVPHAVALSGAGLLADVAVARRERPLLVGPDAESAQWIETAAQRHGLDAVVCTKIRHVIARSTSPCPRTRGSRDVRWCCSTTSPARAARSRVPPSACSRRVRPRSMSPSPTRSSLATRSR